MEEKKEETIADVYEKYEEIENLTVADIVKRFTECVSLIESAAEEAKKERRGLRAKRRADQEDMVSDDTSGDEDIEYKKSQIKKHKIKGFTYENLVNGFKEKAFKKIVVVTGAGISVSAGIPDFRSPNTGLYDNLKQYDLPRPESIFELKYFQSNPEPFYHLARDFLDLNKFEPTLTHKFIKLLDDKELLYLNMTQNIDNLESKTGMNMEKVVQAHGCNSGAACSECQKEFSR